MAASSSSKVAALANIFQQNDGGGRRGSGVYDDGILDRSTKKSKEAEGESKEAGGGLKYFKNVIPLTLSFLAHWRKLSILFPVPVVVEPQGSGVACLGRHCCKFEHHAH